MPPTPEIFLGRLTRREFRQRMEAGELAACILPVAAVEQHLEHLAMEHDWRSAREIASRVAVRLAPRVLVAEGLLAGISEHHMRHPGTLSLKPGSFLAVLYDLIESLTRAGFQHVLVLNGHGGNMAPCAGIWGQFLQLTEVNLHFLSYWDVLGPADAEVLETRSIPGHAQEFETSLALALFPENVRQGVWRDQPDPAPALATAAKGEVLVERIVAGVSRYVEDMLSGRRPAEIPPFFA